MSANFLEALVATLSTGPVGFSDALGFNNASLIKSTCASDGLILKPSLPLAAIDRSFCRIKDSPAAGCGGQGQPPLPPHSQIWATHTAVCDHVWWFAVGISEVSHSLDGANLLRSDLYPSLSAETDVVVWEWCDPAGTATLLKGQHGASPDVSASESLKGGGSVLASMATTETSDGDFKYVIVTPLLPDSGGWAFLGELTKLTPVSEQRGFEFDLAEGFLLKLTSASPGENVTVAAWKAGVVHTHSMVIDSTGEGAVIFQ